MDSRKQAWIWAGLALAGGVGVVVLASSLGGSKAEPPAPGDAPAPGTSPETPPVKREPIVRPGDRVLLLGDSLAVGLSTPLRQLCKGRDATLTAQAKEGTTISAWGSYDPPEQDVCLVSLGTNDMKMLDPLAERPKLDALLARLKGKSRRVVWLAPPPMPFPDRGVLAMIDDALRGSALAAVPSLDVPRAPDKIHPTAAGYAAWAGFIWQLIT